MDTPATESNQPQETSTQNDRLASLLKAQYGDDFHYEPPEPEGQPEEPAAEAPAEPAQAETEAPAPEPEGQPEEVVDFEAEGKQYKVPKELESYLLRDKDYRHKTMELAEERKFVAAEKQIVAQAKQAMVALSPLVAQAQIVDAQIAQLDQTNWQELSQNDPLEFSNRQHIRRNLIDQRQALVNQVGQATQALEQAQQQAFAQEVARNAPIVAKAIPNWGPATQKALYDGAVSTYGYTPEELAYLADARHVQVLHDALEYRKLQAKRPETAKVVTAAPPANKPTAPKTTAAEVEYKKAMDRLAKTGDPDDAIAVLRLKNRRR